MHAKKKKLKTGLKANYAAQTIVSELDENVNRNLDYLLSVNTLTSYLLLLVKKPLEALEFIKIAERIALRLLQATQKLSGLQKTNLEPIGESESQNEFTERPGVQPSQDEEPFFMGKQSQITGMLLSNYILSINLMKSIANKFSNPEHFQRSLEQQLECLQRVEQGLNEIN